MTESVIVRPISLRWGPTKTGIGPPQTADVSNSAQFSLWRWRSLLARTIRLWFGVTNHGVDRGAKSLPLSGNETLEDAVIGDEIFIVDDDPAVRDALSLLFSQAGYRATGFMDGQSFIAAARARTPAGVILDVYMPGSSGLDILREIDAPHYGAPIFVASARSDIPTAVEAMKRGAFDFFEKRSDAESVVARMREAINMRSNGHHNGNGFGTKPRSFPGRELLTPREHAVLALIASGSSNQETADELGISRRTVEVHRAHILAKLNARNTADLVRIVLNHGRGYS